MSETDLKAALKPPRSEHLPFRQDINGLRAIAVVAVIVFHFGLLPVGGGFIGVDVFFVISGFLMTSIIRKDVERDRFSLLRFYSARVRRIVPAFMALCLALLLFGYFLLDPIAYAGLSKSVISSLLFVSNFHYLLTADYFDSVAQDNWLLHTWSLAVEWQFYLLFPLVLVPFAKITDLRRWMMPAFWIALILSLAASAILTPIGPKYAFYLLPTRVWEFMIGAVLTGTGDIPRRLGPVRQFLPYFGIALILASIWLFDSFYPWPSFWALLPTTGAALVIVADHGQARWASNPIIRALGLWSYSLYLWHWPFAVALRYFFETPNGWEITAALAATLACAVLSYTFIERPVAAIKSRGTLGQQNWVMTSMLTMAFAAILIVAIVTQSLGGVPQRVPRPGWLNPYLTAAADNAYPPYCGGETLNGAIRKCYLGNIAGSPESKQILVIGDSFAQEWWSGFAALVAHNPSYGITFATYGGCPILPTVARAHPGFRCADYVDKAYRLAEAGDYGAVFIGSLWLPYFESAYKSAEPNPDVVCFRTGRSCALIKDPQAFAHNADQAFAAFEASIAKLRGEGRRVIVMLPTPFGDIHIPRQMAKSAFRHGGTGDRIWLDAGAIDRRERDIRERLLAIGQRTGAEVIDPRSLTCDSIHCATSDPAGKPLYLDQIHLRSSFISQSGLIERLITGAPTASAAAGANR